MTRSPGNGADTVGRHNAHFGRSPMPDPGVTAVQRQGYPLIRRPVYHFPTTRPSIAIATAAVSEPFPL